MIVQCNILPRQAVELRKTEATPIPVILKRDQRWMSNMLGNFEVVEQVGKTNIEAASKVFDSLSKTTNAVATEITAYSKSSFESGSKAMEQLLGAKSLDKAIEVQSEYAKSIYEDFTARLTKVGQLYADLGKEVFKPLAELTNVSRATSGK